MIVSQTSLTVAAAMAIRGVQAIPHDAVPAAPRPGDELQRSAREPIPRSVPRPRLDEARQLAAERKGQPPRVPAPAALGQPSPSALAAQVIAQHSAAAAEHADTVPSAAAAGAYEQAKALVPRPLRSAMGVVILDDFRRVDVAV
jgi:hypothetical protein